MLVCVRVCVCVLAAAKQRYNLYEIGLNVFKHITQLCQQSTFRTLDNKLLLFCVVLCCVVLCCVVLCCCFVLLFCCVVLLCCCVVVLLCCVVVCSVFCCCVVLHALVVASCAAGL